MFSPDITYNFNDNLSVGASYSHDESRSENYDYTPKEYEGSDPPEEGDNHGDYGIDSNISKTSVSQLYTSYNKNVGAFDARLTFKFLNEYRSYKEVEASGDDPLVGGVKTLDAMDRERISAESYQTLVKTNSYFADINLSYKNKIIFDGLIRRDGSSLFGADNRWENFGRASLAYILTEDFNIPNVNNLKLRFSWGISGQRPGFSTQYETYEISRGRLGPETLGNKNIGTSTVEEWEAGLNTRLFDRVNLEVNYARTHVKNDVILAPSPGVSGFEEQWRNIGGLASSAIEFQLGGDIIRGNNFNWDVNLTWSKIKQEITDLGGVSPFTRSGWGGFLGQKPVSPTVRCMGIR